MTELIVVVVGAFLVIAAAAVLGPRLRIAAPLVLVAVGVAASFLPVFSTLDVDPEWILAGVLPPLLYSSAVSMPPMNFRREFGAISGLSVFLVVLSSLVLGLFFMAVLPEIGFAWGVALGAVVSPTDAVATSIIKQTSVSKRVVAMLDGESLLNDATALVLLRTSIVAVASSFSFWGAVGTFAYSVVVALVIGAAVGWLDLAVRKRVPQPAISTLISFTVPFVAFVPAEALEASGLVAAVVAGLVTGFRAPRVLSPRTRLANAQNWRTVELALEGGVFLTMGVQIRSIVADVQQDHAGVGVAVLVAIGALLLTIAVRAAYVTPLLGVLRRRSQRREQMKPRLEGLQEKVSTPEGSQELLDRAAGRSRDGNRGRRNRRGRTAADLDRFAVRITRLLADIDYFRRQPLGWREGAVVVWAGMRGAVTVAAAQTLPADTPQRAVLVLVAFTVALLSLLVQGGTIGWLIRRLEPPAGTATSDEEELDEQRRVLELLRERAEAIPEPTLPQDAPRQEQFELVMGHRLAVLDAQRSALLDARDNGTFDADVLAHELASLDASQIAMELRGGSSS